MSSKPRTTRFSDVKRAVPMGDLLIFYGWDGEELSKSWNDWTNIHCPFHDDSRSSARYNALKDRFECFACDISGDIFDVVQEVEVLVDVVEAKEWIVKNFLG